MANSHIKNFKPNTVLSGTVDPTTEGKNGDFYINTASWQIFQKAAGVWGTGVDIIGPDGADGADGKTVLYGTAAPTTEGVDGDFYIRTTTNFIYGPKASGTWPAGTSLIGPPGTDGTDGTDGADGDDGTNGNTVLYGTVAPTTEGVNGDFYIRTTTNFIYGPKAGGSWPAGTSLVGPPGADGDDGTDGTDGDDGADGKTILNGSGTPSGGTGADGDFYIDTTAWLIYGPKTAGAWGSGTKISTLRVGTTTSSATPTINTDAVDMYIITAQTADITSFTTNLSGTPVTGQKLWISITGTGARAITWGASFESSTVTLPTTTVSTNRLDVGFVWTGSIWRCVAKA